MPGGIMMRIGFFNRNPYTWTGLSLLITGSLITPSAYFVLQLTWLAALGVCMLIISFILLALGRTIPQLPPEICNLIMETGTNNINSLVEELGIKARAIYLPSSLANGKPHALIPLHSNSSLPSITKALPQRLIVRYGNHPDDVGLLLSTIGSTAIGMLERIPGNSSTELESALTSLLIGGLGVADGVSVIHDENRIKVEISRPRIENKANWSNDCLRGPLASIIASVTAEAWDKPVIINYEQSDSNHSSVEIEVIT
ncbi:hypothetical protein ACFLXD_00290 [Chloroflexota bacterium]